MTSNICPLCNRRDREVKSLLIFKSQYANFLICSDCLEQAYNSWLKTQRDQFIPKSVTSKLMTPEDMVNSLKKTVSGQDNLLKRLSGYIYMHYAQVNKRKNFSKSNMLLIGHSGSGKTLTITSLAKILNVPYVICDATSFTEVGYVGDDVESMLFQLLQAAKGDVNAAERGIIFIDEIDKIRKSEGSSQSKDVSGEGVQKGLLKMLQGGEMRIQNRKRPGETITINTKNILFICGGAFDSLYETMKRELIGTSFGFKGDLSELNNDSSYDLVMQKVAYDHLIKYGFLRELAGRFHAVLPLAELKLSDYLNILTKSDSSYLKEIKEYFADLNISLEVSDDGLNVIAERAIKTKTGARALQSIIYQIVQDLLYIAPKLPAKTKIIITKEVAEGKIKPIINYGASV